MLCRDSVKSLTMPYQFQTFQITPTSSPQFTTEPAKSQMHLPPKQGQLRVAPSLFGRLCSTACLGSCLPSAPIATSRPWCLWKALGTAQSLQNLKKYILTCVLCDRDVLMGCKVMAPLSLRNVSRPPSSQSSRNGSKNWNHKESHLPLFDRVNSYF